MKTSLDAPIHIAGFRKSRSPHILTPELVHPHLTRVTVAPITTTTRGLSTEVPVVPDNGIDQASVISCDNIVTVPTSALGRQLGYLFPAQEPELADAILTTFDLI